MNKKFFIGIFIISLVALAGGCGGSNPPLNSTTSVNAALSGVWSSSNNGTAAITSTNNDSDELDDFIKSLEEIPSDLLNEYEEAKKNEAVAPVNVHVISAIALFEDCDVEDSSGTARLTAIIVLSNDSFSLPLFYDRVAISTQRNNTNEWTATIPDSNESTLSIKMTSEGKINLSGKVRYLDYVCEFNTVIDKNLPNSIKPEVLNGVWKLGSQGGGYLAVNSVITSAVIPEEVSMYFKTNGEKSTLTSFYSLYVKTSGSVNNDESSLLQAINPSSEGTLTQISGNLYKFGDEGIIFLENTDEIFAFMTESSDQGLQTYMFLPLKKVSFNIEAALNKNKNWRAVDGGGYVKINSAGLTGEGAELIKSLNLDTLSFTLNNAALNFSNVNANDEDSVTANVNVNASFSVTDDIFKSLGIAAQTVNTSESGEVTMSRSGNFLQFTDSNADYNLLFISENEAFLSIVSNSNHESSGEGNFALKFTAD